MARYEFRKTKFWAPRVEGKRLVLHFGKLGSAGQTRLKDFSTAAAAKAALAAAVAAKLAEGYVEAAAARPAAKPQASPKRAALIALAQELGGKAIAAEVALGIDDPEAYIAKHVTEYETIEDAEHAEVPWLGLIEALGNARKLAEVDWKECASEILGWLERLGGAAGKRALRPAHAEDATMDDVRPTFEALEWFGSLLAAGKLALLQLDKNSDSYALVVVPAARAAPLQKLARTAGFEIVHFAGKTLPALVAERERAAKRAAKPKNPWAELVAVNAYAATDGAADSVLWGLNHEPKLLANIRAAAPFVPARDKPLVDAVLAIYATPPTKLVKDAPAPEVLLRALRYLYPGDAANRRERLAAAAALADRLRIPLDGGKRHMLIVDACNVWHEGKATDAVVARLPAATRARLARIADAMLARARGEGTDRWDSALRMLRTVGDAASLPGLEAAFAKARKVRAANEWDPDETEWTALVKAIRRRAKA